MKHPHKKYNFASYEQLAWILYQYSGDGLTDVQQFAPRLLADILLANGDAHLKNWSLTFTIARVQQLLDTSFPTANAAVKVLENLNIVTETTGHKTKRQYSYTSFTEVLAS